MKILSQKNEILYEIRMREKNEKPTIDKMKQIQDKDPAMEEWNTKWNKDERKKMKNLP